MSSPFAQPRRPGRAPSTEAAPDEDLGTIYNRHADEVARWAARMAGPGLDVEDLVQEVFLVAHRRLSDFRGDAKITTWLYEITVRVVQDRRRRHRRWGWLFGGGGASDARRDPAGSEEVARMPADQPTALDLLERREAGQLLYGILDGLGEKYRTTIILFELEGLTGQEIATITRTSVSNVWIRLFRGRQQFLKRLLAREAKEREA